MKDIFEEYERYCNDYPSARLSYSEYRARREAGENRRRLALWIDRCCIGIIVLAVIYFTLQWLRVAHSVGGFYG